MADRTLQSRDEGQLTFALCARRDVNMVDNLREQMSTVSPDVYVKALLAWTHVFGFISFELFGQYVGLVRNADVMFDRVMDQLADLLELVD